MRAQGGYDMLRPSWSFRSFRSFRLDSEFNEKLIKIATIVVAIMVVVCIILLIFVLSGKNSIPSSTNNVIGAKGDDVKLSEEGDIEKIKFNVNNMLPGDSETKSYRVTVTNKRFNKVNFSAEIVSDNTALSDFMRVSVSTPNSREPIYEGLIKDMPDKVSADVVGGEETEFTVTVTLDPSAGNECQNSEIAINFSWWIASIGYVQ